MRGQQVADRARAIPQNTRRIFSRGVEDIVIEQENPVFDSGNDRLDQYRIVVLRNFLQIPGKRSFVAQALRKIAARSQKGFDERRSAQFSEMFERVLALVPGRAMGAVPRMQKKILA